MTGAGLLVGALLGAEAYPEFKHLLHSHELDRSGLILPRPIVFSAHSEIGNKNYFTYYLQLDTYLFESFVRRRKTVESSTTISA